MKRIYIFIFFVFYFTLAHKCVALEPFLPDTQLRFTYQNENWIETEHTQASIIFENGLFKQWYTSRQGSLNIAYAYSSDGINWTNLQLDNLLTNSRNIYDPAILKINSDYYLYFASEDNLTAKIMRVVSRTGVDFESVNITPVLTPFGDWETNDVNSPAMFYENNTYYMFYTGHSDKWNMGLAISSDGVTFTKCLNNPILRNDTVPKSVIKLSNTYYLFFHSPNGIEYMETDRLGCDSVWKNRTVALPYGFFPYVLKNGNELWMYYSTLENGQWKMNLAKSKLDEPITGRKPLILIPGLFASWNKEAVLHNQTVSQSDWQVNPFIKEYDGFTRTLETLGYQNKKDYFVFPYD